MQLLKEAAELKIITVGREFGSGGRELGRRLADYLQIAYYDKEIITEIAKMKPYYFVMRDSSLASDNVADNFDQLFETYSKDTIRKII